MTEKFEIQWEGDLPASPEQVWDAITVHSGGWLWPIQYEPRVGGSERGLTGKGTVTAWEPARHFATEAPDRGGVNALDCVLRPTSAGTHLSYRHVGVADEVSEFEAGREHTKFYYHSLGEYLRHFAGQEATYLSADGPESSAEDGFAAIRRALGVLDDASEGDAVRLAPAGLPPIDGIVDYVAPEFLGLRTADALYRFYGRDAWGWPVGLAHHLFADGVDATAAQQAWQSWLDDIFTTEVVA